MRSSAARAAAARLRNWEPAFQWWWERSEELLCQKSKAHGAIVRMKYRLLAACFDTWRERADTLHQEEKALKKRAAKAALKIQLGIAAVVAVIALVQNYTKKDEL